MFFFPFSRLSNIFFWGGEGPFTPGTNPGRDGPVSIQFLKNIYRNVPRITLNNLINTNEIADIRFKISNNVHCVIV